MDTPEELPSRIIYKYEKDPEARLHTAHGVWGGVNPHGEIEISFYHESATLPAASEQIMAPDGSLGHEIVPDDAETRKITRHVHSRILLNYHTAIAVRDWLEERIGELEAESGHEMMGFNGGIEQ